MAEKRPAQKGYFLVVIFFYSCLNMLFYERMLLDLGDLLALSLLRNLFSAARSIFPCKYFSKMAQYFHFSNLIPNFVLLTSRLPDIAQKTACTQNEAMNVTFQIKYVSAF